MNQEIVDAACDLGARVGPVIPLDGKKPILKDWPTRATREPNVAEPEWLTATGVGLLTGERAGHFVLDVDAGKGGLESLAALEQKHGALPATWTTITGGGGRHYYFRWPGFPVSNSAGKLGQGLDVKGDRGQVVAPPSRHKSGNIYRWADGCAPGQIELASAPAALLDLLRPSARQPEPQRPKAPPVRANGQARGYGAGALRNAAAKVLAAPEGQRNQTLNDEAFSLGQLVAGGVIARGEVEVALEEAALAAGLSASETRATIRSGLNAGEKEPRGVPEGGGGARGALGEEPPLPTDTARREGVVEPARFREEPGCDDGDEPDFIPFAGAKVQPFPIDVLPAPLARYVEAVATHLQVPEDGPALMALATISASATRRIRVRRLADGYEQPLNLYLLGLGEPGERKSQIVSEVVRPLREHEGREADRLAEQIALEAQQRQLDEDRIKIIRRILAGGRAKRDPQALRAEMDRLTLALAKPPMRAPRLVTSAPTQGALEQLLADNGERMAILGAEGGVFGIVAGRFSGNGKAPPDMDILLGAWSGDAGDSDRVTRPGTRLKAPALTIGLFVQPQVFREISDIYGADEKGLTSRFLIALVESRAHTQEYFGRPMDLDRREAWGRQIRALLDGLPATTDERIITLPSEVLGPAKAFHDEVTPMMARGGPLALPSLRAFASKLRGQVERLVGVLHVAEYGVHAPDIRCTEDTVERGARLARYFLAHGLAARSAVAVDPVVLRAQRLVEHLVYQHIETFTRRDVQVNRRAGRKPEDVDQVLRELVQRGYATLGRTSRSSPGATGPVYTLTAPAIASVRAQK